MFTYHVSPFLFLVACVPPPYTSCFGTCRRSTFLMSMPLLPQLSMASLLAIPEQESSFGRPKTSRDANPLSPGRCAGKQGVLHLLVVVAALVDA